MNMKSYPKLGNVKTCKLKIRNLRADNEENNKKPAHSSSDSRFKR